jgi:short-subunit dehydrogenase
MVDLHDKVVIVTGASSGIGAALAKTFSRHGSMVMLVARRLDRLKEVASACPGDTLTLSADLVKDNDRKAVVKTAVDHWGKIDVLVNNAGIGIYGDFMSTTEAEWRKIFEINLLSAVFLTQTVLPVMMSRGKGLIINIASIGALIAHSDKVTPYVASKHAILGFSRGLEKDLAETDIRVIAVCPHLTATEFFGASPGAEEMAPVIKKYRDFMDTPETVAQGILEHLDSDRLVVFPTSKPARAYEKQRDI